MLRPCFVYVKIWYNVQALLQRHQATVQTVHPFRLLSHLIFYHIVMYDVDRTNRCDSENLSVSTVNTYKKICFSLCNLCCSLLR